MIRRLRSLFIGGWALAACSMAVSGPWLDENGQRLEGSQLIQYQGFNECGHEEVDFMIFFGNMYAKDPAGVLGPLTNPAGEELTFEILTEVPEGVTGQGLTFRDQEIYLDPSTREDYVYIRYGGENLERWPRAEFPCDRPGS